MFERRLNNRASFPVYLENYPEYISRIMRWARGPWEDTSYQCLLGNFQRWRTKLAINCTFSNFLCSWGLNVKSVYESWVMVASVATMLAIQNVTLKRCTDLLVPGNFIRNIDCNQYVEYLKDSRFWLHPRVSLIIVNRNRH